MFRKIMGRLTLAAALLGSALGFAQQNKVLTNLQPGTYTLKRFGPNIGASMCGDRILKFTQASQSADHLALGARFAIETQPNATPSDDKDPGGCPNPSSNQREDSDNRTIITTESLILCPNDRMGTRTTLIIEATRITLLWEDLSKRPAGKPAVKFECVWEMSNRDPQATAQPTAQPLAQPAEKK